MLILLSGKFGAGAFREHVKVSVCVYESGAVRVNTSRTWPLWHWGGARVCVHEPICLTDTTDGTDTNHPPAGDCALFKNRFNQHILIHSWCKKKIYFIC